MHFNTLIIMNEDALGYGSRSRKPYGYCKLTMPNRVSCYVQGLRQLPEGQIYKLYLTSKEKDKSIEVGMLQVGANGNKETRWIMEPSSINNSGVNAKEIDGALIRVEGESVKGNVVPLVGFSSEPYTWDHLIKDQKIEVEKEKPKKVEKAAEVEVVAEVFLEESKEREEVARDLEEASRQIVEPKESIVDKVMSDEILALREEVEKLNRTIEESKEIIEKLQSQSLESLESSEPSEATESSTGINDYVNSFIRKFQTVEKKKDEPEAIEIDSIFKNRIPINPFEAPNMDTKWVRITSDDLKLLPSLSPEWINQDLITNANREYKHFILGKDKSGLTYYLGIPGVFDPDQDDVLSIDQIERFACCHDIPPRVGEAGYWIALI